MGISDLYCKICNGPFDLPLDDNAPTDRSDDEFEKMSDEEITKWFGWIHHGAVVYPDGRICQTKGYITNEGVTSINGIILCPVRGIIEAEWSLDPHLYWRGLVVHQKCLNLSGFCINGSMDPKRYNQMFFNPISHDGWCKSNEDYHQYHQHHQLCEHTGQRFEWYFFLQSEDKHLLYDPDLDPESKKRILTEIEFVKNLPLTYGNEDYNLDEGIATVNTPRGLVSFPYKSKYMILTIVGSTEEFISPFYQLLGVQNRSAVIRMLESANMIVGPRDVSHDPSDMWSESWMRRPTS